MLDKCRSSLLLAFAILAMLSFAAAASAQDCDQCDPYTSHCNDYCDRCTHYGIDGCTTSVADTCGGSHNLEGNCLQNGCTPSWQETSRVTQGTYGAAGPSECNHHAMQWVTITDSNHCNGNSYWWTNHYCDNVIDGQKTGGWYPDCCDGWDGWGNQNSLFTCNGYHSCTG